MAYHIYMSDAIKIISRNSANLNGGEYLQIRFADQILSDDKKEETRTADEIKTDLKQKIKALGGE